MSAVCLGCDADDTYCLEVGGCCDSCDHRPDDPGLPDDVALPGLEHGDNVRRWSKAASGYLAHLAELDYPEPWTFWGLCTPERELTDHRGDHTAEETECVWLIGGGRVCRALIVIEFGAILHEIEYSLTASKEVHRG